MAFHFKPEVGMSAGLAAAVLVQVATEVFDRYHAECWLTSANDGTHRADSFHYRDLAWDLRTQHLKPLDKRTLVRELRQRLLPQFEVIFEDEGGPNEHVHVEYDTGRLP